MIPENTKVKGGSGTNREHLRERARFRAIDQDQFQRQISAMEQDLGHPAPFLRDPG